MGVNKLFSVVYECTFVKTAFCEGDIYKEGEIEFYSLILTADSFSIAVDKAIDYAAEHYPNCDVSIKSIISL